ncbi:cytochrome P450 76M5-like [Triticum dicoccoides]|uniref:cytochrome P450 76M5-like n=1 Tax=Triticum dicoccoides TaxID=85692 RepID=UPI001890EB1C|nr:cytochrome P450 76M5-like [Triticum dicoccoides]
MQSEIWLLWATLSAALLYYLTKVARRGTGRLPPGPRPLPVLGNLLDLPGDLHHTLARLARAHGPVMMLKLGITATVVVSSRDAAREAYTKYDRHLAGRAIPDVANALGNFKRSMIWLTGSDPLWQTLRGIVASHIFSPGGLAMVRGVRERKVRDMLVYFRHRAGQEVDVGHGVYGGVLNLVSSAFFSVDVVDLGGESAHGLRELVEDIITALAKPNVSDIFPFLRPLDLQGWRRWVAGRYGKVFGILDDIIGRRLSLRGALTTKGKHKHGDFLDSLLELVSKGKIGRDMATTMLFDVFAAGTDTIAITIEWAMAELLRNPRVMAKVRAEMDVKLGGKDTVEEPDAANLPYLQAVVKEVMRLHPVSPILLPHQAVEDGVEIGGYTVPKGSRVIFNVWAIMRDRAAWERPDEFVPERFLDMADMVDFRGKHFQFIPFGSGRRLCPGLPMAERVVPFILASLLHAFEWRLPDRVSADELDVSEKFTTVNALAVPLKALPFVLT